MLVSSLRVRSAGDRFKCAGFISTQAARGRWTELSRNLTTYCVRGGWEREVAAALGNALQARQWDEFVAEGLAPNSVLSWLEPEALGGSWSKTIRGSFYVDLVQIRQAKTPYEDYLSANTRQQLRRSLKIYRRRGTICTEVAHDLCSAQAMFDELIELHQRTWKARGQPGAFASPRRVEFFRALIARAFPAGAIQMLRVAVGQVTIGVLLNFVQKGKVYFFQSGFNYSQEGHLKPGLVTHACAIRHCLDQGSEEYDLLAGDAQYKRSLAKDQRPLAWMVFARPNLKLAIIERLRALKRVAKRRARNRAEG